jgi:hypothetical protein
VCGKKEEKGEKKGIIRTLAVVDVSDDGKVPYPIRREVGERLGATGTSDGLSRRKSERRLRRKGRKNHVQTAEP